MKSFRSSTAPLKILRTSHIGIAAVVVLLLLLGIFFSSSGKVSTEQKLPSKKELYTPPAGLNPEPTINIYKAARQNGYYSSAKNRLAILVNFFEGQTDRLLNSMNMWANWFPPCSIPAGPGHVVDLVFYSSQTLSQQARDRISAFLDEHPSIESCFGEISFRSANLFQEQDRYSTAHTEMFHQWVVHHPSERPYTHFFNMEPDVLPFRPHWIELLLEEVDFPTDFWVKGSAPPDPGSKNFNPDIWYPHINGNSLYRYDSEEFRDFLKRAKWHYKKATDSNGDPSHSLDMSMYSFVLEERRFKYIHRLVFSRFILNHPPTTYERLVSQNPDTFMVHGSEWIPLIKPLANPLPSRSQRSTVARSPVILSAPSKPSIVSSAVSDSDKWLQLWLQDTKKSPKYLECSSNGHGSFVDQMWEFLHCSFAAALSNRVLVYTYGAKLKPVLDVPIKFIDSNTLPPLSVSSHEPASYFSCHDLNQLFGSADHVKVSFLRSSQPQFFTLGHYMYLNPYHGATMRQVFGSSPYHNMANFLLRPRTDLAQEIDTYVSKNIRPYKTIGVHIVDDKALFKGKPEEQAKAFMACVQPWMDEVTKSGDEWRMYLSTTSPAIRAIFFKKYGAKYVLDFESSDDRKVLSIDESLVTDLWTLKETDYFVGTFYSPLSAFASIIRSPEHPTHYVLNDGQCIMADSNESFLPDKDISEMYPALQHALSEAESHSCVKEVLRTQFGLDKKRS